MTVSLTESGDVLLKPVTRHVDEVYGRPGRRNELYLGQREAIAAERRNDHNG